MGGNQGRMYGSGSLNSGIKKKKMRKTQEKNQRSGSPEEESQGVLRGIADAKIKEKGKPMASKKSHQRKKRRSEVQNTIKAGSNMIQIGKSSLKKTGEQVFPRRNKRKKEGPSHS